MKTVQYYFKYFVTLFANYMANENDESIDDSMHIDELKSYIMSAKSRVSNKNFLFFAGAAWGVTLIRILDDNGFVPEGTSTIGDPLTDMVEDFVGIRIP